MRYRALYIKLAETKLQPLKFWFLSYCIPRLQNNFIFILGCIVFEISTQGNNFQTTKHYDTVLTNKHINLKLPLPQSETLPV